MLALIPNPLKIAGAALLGASVTFGVYSLANSLWWLPEARREGRQIEREAAFERAVELKKQMERNNADLRDMSVHDLCVELGGMPDACGD